MMRFISRLSYESPIDLSTDMFSTDQVMSGTLLVVRKIAKLATTCRFYLYMAIKRLPLDDFAFEDRG